MLTLIDKDLAMGPVFFAKIKLVIICLFFILTIFLISHVLSGNLTKNLDTLIDATKGVKSGDFNLRVDINSKDEFGDLAKSFNEMTGEIHRLLDETAEKARMEGELETARMVQANLFPELTYEDENISIHGYYQPASECGGDWWFHSHIGNKTYLWIGDATGHGASAALVTSAAKSAANVAQQKENIAINEILYLMNNAIYETTKGKVNMTFFLACYDHKTHELSYSRASHDPPFIMKDNEKPLARNSIGILMETDGRRLGEAPNNQYEIHKVELSPGDRILFYTDGITELYNPENKMFGERKVIKLILKTFNKEVSLAETNRLLLEELESFRKGEPLHDDVTYFFFERKKLSTDARYLKLRSNTKR